MEKKFNLSGKGQKKESQEKGQNHQNAKNVEQFGKDQSQNAHSVSQNYLNLTLKNFTNLLKRNPKKKILLQVVLPLKVKMKKKRYHLKKKSLNLRNQNVQIAKKNCHSSLESMDIDMDL